MTEPFGPNHSFMRSGSVKHFHKTSGVAANTRVMTNSVALVCVSMFFLSSFCTVSLGPLGPSSRRRTCRSACQSAARRTSCPSAWSPARRNHRLVWRLFKAHQHFGLGTDRRFVERQSFVAFAVEKQIRLHVHYALLLHCGVGEEFSLLRGLTRSRMFAKSRVIF